MFVDADHREKRSHQAMHAHELDLTAFGFFGCHPIQDAASRRKINADQLVARNLKCLTARLQLTISQRLRSVSQDGTAQL
jgi:hypothetical protein